jgi:hypothetical protein
MLGDFFSRVVFIDISQERVEILRFYRHDVSCGVCGTVDWIPAFAGMTGFLGVRSFHPFVTPAQAGVHGAAGAVLGFVIRSFAIWHKNAILMPNGGM